MTGGVDHLLEDGVEVGFEVVGEWGAEAVPVLVVPEIYGFGFVWSAVSCFDFVDEEVLAVCIAELGL